MIEQSKHYALAITCGAKRGPKDTDLTFSPSSLRDFLKALAEPPALTATYTCGVCGVSMQMEQPAQPQQEPVAWPAGLIERIKAAEQRIQDGHAPRRIPADPTDVDLVLAEVRYLLEGKQPPFWVHTSPQPAQRKSWVGLTDEDIKEAEWLLSAIKEHEAYTLQEQLLVEGVDVFARAIEAKLREKNT